MNPAWFALIGMFLLIGLYVSHRFYYDYRIRGNDLRVTWFGIPVRKLPIANIESISKRRKFTAENWSNTWRPRHRILVLRKKRGWRRDFIITPSYRYEFRNQLEAAMARIAGD